MLASFYRVEYGIVGKISTGCGGRRMSKAISPAKPVHRKGLIYELKANRSLFIMLLPSVFFFILFCYLPMVGISLAFQDYRYGKGFFGSPFVGLDKFQFFFISGKAWLVTTNTILYNLAFIVTGVTVQMAMAVFFSEMKAKWYKKISQSLMFLPYFISWVVVSAIAYSFFNYEFGTINTLLRQLNAVPIDIYGNPKVWPFILVSFNLWKYVGYGSVIYLAAITSINPELYEAAAIDGANIFQRIFRITLPMIKPTVIVLLLFQISAILKGNFDLFYQLIGENGLLFDKTDVIDTFVFRSLMNSGGDFGLVAAAGLYQQVLGFVIIMTVNLIVKKANSEYALF